MQPGRFNHAVDQSSASDIWLSYSDTFDLRRDVRCSAQCCSEVDLGLAHHGGREFNLEVGVDRASGPQAWELEVIDSFDEVVPRLGTTIEENNFSTVAIVQALDTVSIDLLDQLLVLLQDECINNLGFNSVEVSLMDLGLEAWSRESLHVNRVFKQVVRYPLIRSQAFPVAYWVFMVFSNGKFGNFSKVFGGDKSGFDPGGRGVPRGHDDPLIKDVSILNNRSRKCGVLALSGSFLQLFGSFLSTGRSSCRPGVTPRGAGLGDPPVVTVKDVSVLFRSISSRKV